MKLLIIDDNVDSLEVAKIRLARESLDIVCADGGIPGLEMARRELPDLILLDLEMPDLCGFDVCRALKADPDLCMIPVLFLSGSTTAEDKVRGLDLGAIDYITKPFDAFELRARVRAALRTKHLQDLLIEHAHIDPLTGLPNRRALMERLQSEWARLQRHGGSLSVIMADLDHFKRINDTYGHHIGDKMLQEAAQAIAKQCRKTDLPGRYGGEEFVVLVPDEQATGAACLAERCRREVAKISVVVQDKPVQITASFGVADATNLATQELLIERADDALYQAKTAGRNAVHACNATPDSPPIDPPQNATLTPGVAQA
jgi:two-component system, cell cycle response regulator